MQIRHAPKNSSLRGGVKEKAALRMQGLPWKSNEEDIAEFFYGYNMVPDSVKYQHSDEGKRTGHAAVLFES